MQISDSGVDRLSQAIFAIDNPQVVEAYSEYDFEPISFKSSSELASYIKQKISSPKGIAYVFVVYPDMQGKATKKRIELDPLRVPNHKFRYTWEGWGLIYIQITAPNLGVTSNISVNSEARAIKWAATHPELELPSTWNWQAVKRHQSRLQRVLKKET